MELLQTIRRREEVIEVPEPAIEPQPEVWGIPLGGPREARRNIRMGQQPRRPLPHVYRRQPPQPGPRARPVVRPPRNNVAGAAQVPVVIVPRLRIRRDTSFMNRRTVTPPAEPKVEPELLQIARELVVKEEPVSGEE